MNELDKALEDLITPEKGKKPFKLPNEVNPITVRVEKILKPPEDVEIARETLNEEQNVLFDNLVKFLKDPDKDFCVVIGYAGTGKTYTVSKFISAIQGQVAMTAPTNKAVKVLMDNKTPEMSGVLFSTIHKMLALRLKMIYPKDGENFKPYQKLVKQFKGVVTLNDYQVLILDECSMLDDELFHMIKNEKHPELKVIFLGDPAQIPPVGRLDSIPLLEDERKEYLINDYHLEKIMRQADGSNILRVAYSIRTKRFGIADVIEDRTLKGDVHFMAVANEAHKNKFMNHMLAAFNSNEFKADPNYCKVIAWTNRTVDAFNKFIRSSIYGIPVDQLKPIMEGEKLIANTPIMKPGISGSVIIFNTADEFEVLEYEQKTFVYEIKNSAKKQQVVMTGMDMPTKGKEFTFDYFHTVVKYRLIGEATVEGEPIYLNERIMILAPESIKVLGWLIGDLIKRKQWSEYEKIANKFAQVKYNYAITCHKAQGSTYNKVFLIEDDIDKNQDMVERNRIKYTAASRPKDDLYILSKRNPL